jgi:acyl carrier protein
MLHAQVIRILNDVMQLELDPQIDDVQREQIEQWDSVNHLRLVMELEETFDSTLSDEEVLSMQSLQQIERVLQLHQVGEET